MEKVYSKVGFKYAIFTLTVIVVQLILPLLLRLAFGVEAESREWYYWVILSVSTYLCGFPVLLFLLKKTKKESPVQNTMGFWKFISFVLIGAFIVGVGAIVGFIVNLSITLPAGIDANETNELSELLVNSKLIYRILVVGILAPVFEELIFRKLLIDRLQKYGIMPAIILSGLMFGMFHGNFIQFFFTMGLGMLWAYVYVKTGRIWYTMILHSILNLSTSVISVYVISGIKIEKLEKISEMNPALEEAQLMVLDILPQMTALLLWFGVLVTSFLVGMVLFILFIRKVKRQRITTKNENEGSVKKALFNPGMAVYYVLILILFVLYYLPFYM